MHVGYALAYQFDYNIDNKYGNKPLDYGGNGLDDVLYWTSGLGPVSTEKFPVTSESEPVELPATDILVQTENVQVDNALFLPTIDILNATEEERTNYINLIKQTILDNGAVAFASAGPSSTTWYNRNNYAVYTESYSEYASAAHEMLIVGWDDNFSKEKFNKGSITGEYPAIDGAWIVQNSWGEDSGDNGYYYYSYMDYNLNYVDIMAVSKTSEINYDNIYQYNPTGDIGEMSGKYAANVFSKSKNKETLTEVSFYNFYPDTEYKIYVNPINDELTGENVKYLQTYTDTNAFAEYINVELDEPMELTGEKFAIILEISNSKYSYSIPYLMRANRNVEKDYVDIKEGQSFVSSNGENYSDTVNSGAIFIKAFTTNVSEGAQVELKSTINTNEIKLKGEEEGLLVTTNAQGITDKEKLNYTIYNSADEDVTEKFGITKSSNGNTYYANVVVPNDYSLVGNYKIKIQYEAVEEILEFIITRKPITEINFARSSVYLQKDDTSNLAHKTTILPEDIINPEIKYRSLDESIATVTEEGIVTAISEGNTKVEIYADDGGNASKQVGIIVVNLQEKMAGGDGTEENPYLIETPEQLNLIRADLTACYKLNNDIDLTQETSEGGKFYNNGKGWEPIGYAVYDSYDSGGTLVFYRLIIQLRSAYKREGFSGTLDGNNYSIKGLNIYADDDFVSLFGLVENATIKNIKMSNGYIEGRRFVGGIAGGAIDSTIENIYNLNSISGHTITGGIIGEADECNISRVYNLGKIKGKYYYSIENGMRYQYLPERIGGIIGSFVLGNLKIAYNNADLEVDRACRVGGICGSSTGTIENVYNRGNIIEKESYGNAVGGIVGISRVKTVVYPSINIISKAYNVGKFYSSSLPSDDNAKNTSIGSVVGLNERVNLTIYDVYVIESENESTGKINGGGNINIITYKKTEEELKQKETYVNFDFENIWKINEGEFPTFIGLEKEILSLNLKKLPDRLYYLHNKDSIDLTGLEIVAIYEDGTNEEVEVTPAMVTGFENTKLGTQEITVTYNEFTVTFTVTVEEGTTWDISATEEDNVKAKYFSDGRLVISGTGNMCELSNQPWIQYINNIKYVEIREGVTSIGNQMLASAIELLEVEIPETITKIGDQVFFNCPKLENIKVNKNNAYYSSKEGVLFNKEQTEFIQYPAGKKLNYYTIPSTVRTIKTFAFNYCEYLETIEISKTVEVIERFSINNCININKIVIPKTVTTMNRRIVFSCENATIYTNSSYVADYAETDGISYVLDEVAPIISEIKKENNTITIIGATDGEGVGLAQKPYSFDGGLTWQEENYKEYEEMPGIVKIQVRDELDNIYEETYGEGTPEKEQTPESVINWKTNQLSGLSKESAYRVSGENVKTMTFSLEDETAYYIEDDWYGKTISLVKINADEQYNSDPQIIVIPALRDAPTDIGSTPASNSQASDGSITGWSNEMEFSEDEITWIKCTEESTKNLEYGMYYIRYSYIEDSQFASDRKWIGVAVNNLHFNTSKELSISAGTINTTIEEINLKSLAEIDGGFLPYTYTKISGPDWINISNEGIITGTRPSQAEEATTAVIEVKDSYNYKINITINIGEVTDASSMPLKGDINKDGKLSLYDAFTILRKIITEDELTEEQLYIVDYNNDGKATLYDAFSFLRMIILM